MTKGSPTKKTNYSNEGPSIDNNIKSDLLKEAAHRKKKKTIANKDIRKQRFAYNEYVERKSILDQVYSDSLIS